MPSAVFPQFDSSDAVASHAAPQIHVPDWLRRLSADAPSGLGSDRAVAAGAALALLHLVRADAAMPQAVWRARQALSAAGSMTLLSGRRTDDTALRDALCLLRPGDHPGPVGEVMLVWERLTARPLSQATLARALPRLTEGQRAIWLAPRHGNPLAQAAQILEGALQYAPRDTLGALALADAALARALGWDHVVPLLAVGIRARDLRGEDMPSVCHHALVRAAGPALAQAADLTRRAQRLRLLGPRLRAKAAERALQIFLTHDAITPAMLAEALPDVMSDRAARRLCDRLVVLGGLRELTGRAVFRLYGL